MMTTGYGLLVSDRELTVADAAEALQVSEDTVRALIRSHQLPAVQRRIRGAYYLKEADVQAVKEQRSSGLLAGPVTMDPVELALLLADEMEARELRARTKAVETRRNNRARNIRATSGAGYGAVTDMSEVLGLHRTVVQRWLREAVDEQATADVEAAAAAATAARIEADRAVAVARAERRAEQRLNDDSIPDDSTT